MTLHFVTASLRNRWWVFLLGLCVTVAAGLACYAAPGTYWATTKVIFLVPTTDIQPNPLAPDNGRSIGLAGIVAAEINGGSPRRNVVGVDVELVDQGITDGWSVRLPDSGGQWAHNFAEPALVVQASGPTPEVVLARTDALVKEVERRVRQREDAAGVSSGLRITFLHSPAQTVVHYGEGSRSRALLVIGVLGVGTSVALAVVADRVLSRRARS